MKVGTTVMLLGAAVVAVGAILRWAPWLLSWFGHLPGDIRHEGERTSVFIPITSMLVVSLVASVVASLLLRRGG